MNKIKELISVSETRVTLKYFLLLMFIAFAFSVSVRYIWVDTFSGYDAFKWNNELMINTNDGYYYAEGARDILAGSHQEHDLSPVKTPLALVTAFLAKILPLSFETLVLWMPGIFGSFLVLPIMLIARVFKQDILGFSAALLGSIVWSYYNRTMIGYYDTDMLVVVLPTLAIWGTLYALTKEKILTLLWAPLFALLSVHWHSGTINIVNGVFIMTLLYTLVYERKNLFYYKFLTVFVLVLTTLPFLLKGALVVVLVAFFYIMKDKLSEKAVIFVAVVSAIVYLIFGGFDWIMSVLHNTYVTRLMAADTIDYASLKFFAVVNTVREAGHIPFETFANRISGDTTTFIIGTIGYILLLIRYRLMLISLPMVVLGFFALQGGLRFTVFAVPFIALGTAYVIFIVAEIFQKFFSEKSAQYAKYGFITLLSVAVLYPNIKHVIAYKVPTVFTKNEVQVLDKLGKIASREDYVVSWWDYGYPIRYYADVKTLIDGGKHSGEANFPVAFALTAPQVAAANMARLDVEFTEKSYKDNCGSSIKCMLKAYHAKNPNEFLKALNNKNMQRPQKTRDIYFYLPNKMMGILPTVDMFSNINIVTGKSLKRPFFYMSKNFKEQNSVIYLGNNISIDKKDATVSINGQKVQLNYFIHTFYDSKGAYKVDGKQINNQSPLSVVFMDSLHQFLVVDNRVLNSLYFRLFVLEDYDKDLFEPVISSPLAKVYKLKI